MLLYHIKGMTPDRVARMNQREIDWWMSRLVEQKQFEADNNIWPV